jgi:hypothetical protein
MPISRVRYVTTLPFLVVDAHDRTQRRDTAHYLRGMRECVPIAWHEGLLAKLLQNVFAPVIPHTTTPNDILFRNHRPESGHCDGGLLLGRLARTRR